MKGVLSLFYFSKLNNKQWNKQTVIKKLNIIKLSIILNILIQGFDKNPIIISSSCHHYDKIWMFVN